MRDMQTRSPISITMDGKLFALTPREIEIKRRLVEATRAVRMKRDKIRMAEEAQKEAFERKFNSIIEPLKMLAAKSEEIEDGIKSEKEYVFEDAGEDKASESLLQKRLPNDFDTTYYDYDQGHLMMGNNPIAFDGDVMLVQDGSGRTVSEHYLTPGLMELVFNNKLPET